MYLDTAAILRRIRIRSWTDVVMFVVAIAIIVGG